jgi:hypothetical protein
VCVCSLSRKCNNACALQVLADSLGGNCKTIMIANVSCDATELDESIATCRFAQRVACIKQNAKVNEELDPARPPVGHHSHAEDKERGSGSSRSDCGAKGPHRGNAGGDASKGVRAGM